MPIQQNHVSTGKKAWIKPQVLERTSLAEAQVTKVQALIELVVLNVQNGPHS